MDGDSPESIARSVVEACADCEVCRYVMTDTGLFFEDLYRRHDQAAADGRPLSSEALRRLVERCHDCALCGCPDIRARIIVACLSCRLQFMQLTDIPVAHPLEVIVDHLDGSH